MTFAFHRRTRTALALSLACLAATAAHAQTAATVKTDGQWRYALGAGASFASGNSDATAANLNVDTVRATAGDKLHLYGRAVYARSDDETTAENLAIAGQYDRDISRNLFAFGKLDGLRDEPANIASRYSVFGGIGRHMLRTPDNNVDVSLGIGYTHDSYVEAAVADGELRSRYGRSELSLAEESNHRLTSTTTLQQKFQVFPNLRNTGDYRATFDAGLAVAMTPVLSLTATLTYRFDSDPGANLKRSDTLFMTGIAVKID